MTTPLRPRRRAYVNHYKEGDAERTHLVASAFAAPIRARHEAAVHLFDDGTWRHSMITNAVLSEEQVSK